MGVNKFTRLYNGACIERKLSYYMGKRLIIDTSHLLYKNCIGRRSFNKDIINEDGKDITHIYILLNFCIKLLQESITPIFVFDGESPIEKNKVIEKRKKNRLKAIKKCQLIENKLGSNNNETNRLLEKEYLKNYAKSFKITKTIIDDSKKLLDLMGIKFIEANGEADKYCALLSLTNKNIGGIVSGDSDMLVYGGNAMINITSLNNNKIIEYNKTNVLNLLLNNINNIRIKYNLPLITSITHNNFVEISILMGCDYTDKNFINIKHPNNKYIFNKWNEIDPYKLLEKYTLGDLDIRKMDITINYDKFEEIKNIYLSNSNITNKLLIDDTNLIKIDTNKIMEFLIDEIKIPKNYVKSRVYEYMRLRNKIFKIDSESDIWIRGLQINNNHNKFNYYK